MARDYYAILGLTPDATDNDIKKAYRRLARKYHPDVNSTEEAAEKFSEISIAQELLLDPEKRRIIDMGGDPLAGPSGAPGNMGGFGGFSDIFDAFFGGGAGTRGPRSRVQPGNDALLRTTITLEEAYSGVEQEVTIDTAVVCETCEGTGSESKQKPETCTHCDGMGEVQQVQRSFLGNVMTTSTCPACGGYGEIIPDTMRVRMAGQGEVGHGGGPAGDLYVEVDVKPHPVFTREKDNLHLTVHVPMVDAALGSTVAVQSLDGTMIDFVIPAGTQPADRLVVSGKGMPRLRGEGFGNMIAHVDVTVPRELDDKSRELLEKLRRHRAEEAGVHADESEHGSVFSKLRNRFRK